MQPHLTSGQTKQGQGQYFGHWCNWNKMGYGCEGAEGEAERGRLKQELLGSPRDDSDCPREFFYLLLIIYQSSPTLHKLEKYLCTHGESLIYYLYTPQFGHEHAQCTIVRIGLIFHTLLLCVPVSIVVKCVVHLKTLNIMKYSKFCSGRFHYLSNHQVKADITQLLLPEV